MKLKTNINGIEAEIEKSSIISGYNGTGKSSILSSVEIGIYGTHYGVRPKIKGDVEFKSEYLETAREYPLADIINCRFLDLEPIKKKQILLNLIDTKSIEKTFGKFWKGDVISSIDYVKVSIKKVKDLLKKTETKVEMLEGQKTNKEEKLKTYAKTYDTEFDFIDTKELINKINKCQNDINEVIKEGKQAKIDKCITCGGKIEIDENKLKSSKARYHLLTQDLEEYKNELKQIEEYNTKGSQIQENIKLNSEKNYLITDIENTEKLIEKEVNILVELQNDEVLELENYVKKDIYSEISKQLNIDGFEIDLTKNFEITFNGKDYREMSRGQKYTANIYFSIGILKMLNCKVIIIDDFEMIDVDTRKQIEKDVEGFDYLIGIVSDKKLTY